MVWSRSLPDNYDDVDALLLDVLSRMSSYTCCIFWLVGYWGTRLHHTFSNLLSITDAHSNSKLLCTFRQFTFV